MTTCSYSLPHLIPLRLTLLSLRGCGGCFSQAVQFVLTSHRDWPVSTFSQVSSCSPHPRVPALNLESGEQVPGSKGDGLAEGGGPGHLPRL